MYDSVTGKKLAPLALGNGASQLSFLRKLGTLAELPEAATSWIDYFDGLNERLSQEKPVIPPLPATTADIEAFAAYQAAKHRLDADSAECDAARGEKEYMLSGMRVNGLPGKHRPIGQLVSSIRDELIRLLNDVATSIVSKSKVSEADRATWLWLGEQYVKLVSSAPADARDIELHRWGSKPNGVMEPVFYCNRIRLLIEDPRMIWERPDEAVDNAVLSRYKGFPSLGDVMLSKGAGFRLLNNSEAIALARYQAALDVQKGLGRYSKVELSERIASYIDKQIEAKGFHDFNIGD
jgi:hypothetical protein